MILAAACGVVGAIVGIIAWEMPRRVLARRRNARCTWCGARRDNPRRPVCNLCLETVHPMASQHGWPEDE